ncbi:type III pantothenate kinase [Salinispira pacifica]
MIAERKALLCVNIGNSNIALGIFERGRLINRWRLATQTRKTADEYEIDIRALLALAGRESVSAPVLSVGEAVIGSVVSSLAATFVDTCRKLSGRAPVVVAPGVETGLTIDIDNPTEIGADLVANAVAGYHTYRSNCIVVDFGTALSFTVVSKEGRLLGASIAPGVQVGMEALSRSTDQLPHVPLIEPPTAVGRNTIHAIQSGVVFGYIGLVESIVARIRSELSGETLVVATGGLSQTMAPLVSCIDRIEPWLTLEGLRIIGDLNSPGRSV